MIDILFFMNYIKINQNAYTQNQYGIKILKCEKTKKACLNRHAFFVYMI